MLPHASPSAPASPAPDSAEAAVLATTDDGRESALSRRPRPQLAARRRLIKDILEVIFLVLTIYTGVNLATARAIVEGNSMQPNFATGQLVIVNRFAYFFSKPERGDVVVLHNPAQRCADVVKNRSLISLPFINQDTSAGCEDLIKRIVGLPGETVQIIAGKVVVNGTTIDEPYVATENFCPNSCDRGFQLGADEYLVLGDNRRNSYDGHSFGPINGELIVGQAWVRYWPLDQARMIAHPSYGPVSQTPIALPTATPSNTPFPTVLPGSYGGTSRRDHLGTPMPDLDVWANQPIN